MNRRVWSFTLLCFLSIIPRVDAGDLRERYDEALGKYREARYLEAITLFESICSEGHTSFELYYNLGNAYYKNGDLGKGILNFERALRLEPRNPDAMHNLNVVRARTRDRVEPMPLIFFVRWWNDLKQSYKPTVFLIWSTVLFWCLAIAVFVFFGFKARITRRLALLSGIVFAVAFTISFLLYQFRITDLNEHRFAVVMESEVPVLSAPDESAIESFVIHEGLTVEVLDSDGTLMNIRLADGKSGWVPASAVERI